MFICSDTETKRRDDYLMNKEALIFGTGGRASCHYVNEPFSYSTDCVVALPKSSEYVCKFYYYYLRQNCLGQLQNTFSGSGLQHTSKKKIGALLVPVLPRKEQERIVSKIDGLFPPLDSGLKTLQTVKRKMLLYRQAILKDAFEGAFTTGWRNNHRTAANEDFEKIRKNDQVFKDISGDENELYLRLPDSWLKVRLGCVFDVEVGATPKRAVPAYWNGTINWVSSGEVKFTFIDKTNEKITAAGLAKSSTNLQPVGTVMLAMIGEGKTRGQAAILQVEAAHNQNTAAILVSKTPCTPKFIYYFLMLAYANTRRIGSGNNQKALNKERVRALRFPFASFEEQELIVTEIENRFAVCDAIERSVDTALQQADAMRQSILKNAFEGNL